MFLVTTVQPNPGFQLRPIADLATIEVGKIFNKDKKNNTAREAISVLNKLDCSFTGMLDRPTEVPIGLASMPGGRIAYFEWNNGTLWIFDALTCALIETCEGFERRSFGIGYSSETDLLYLNIGNNIVQSIDPDNCFSSTHCNDQTTTVGACTCDFNFTHF